MYRIFSAVISVEKCLISNGQLKPSPAQASGTQWRNIDIVAQGRRKWFEIEFYHRNNRIFQTQKAPEMNVVLTVGKIVSAQSKTYHAAGQRFIVAVLPGMVCLQSEVSIGRHAKAEPE